MLFRKQVSEAARALHPDIFEQPVSLWVPGRFFQQPVPADQ
jgi:hypothetical protein